MGYDPTYLTKQVGKGAENYYLSSVGDADRGEPPGIWVGRACAELGFTPGAEVNAAVFERLFGTFADPRAPEFDDPAVAAGVDGHEPDLRPFIHPPDREVRDSSRGRPSARVSWKVQDINEAADGQTKIDPDADSTGPWSPDNGTGEPLTEAQP